MDRSRALGARSATAALLLAPALLTGFFAAHSGGYFSGPTGVAAVGVCIVLALLVACNRPWRFWTPGLLIAFVALSAFAVWILISSDWSKSPARARPEFDRALLYAATLLLFGSIGRSPRRLRVMTYALVLAILGICVPALISRTLPHVITYMGPVHPERLSFPLSYWNTLGILAGIGVVFCGHLCCSTRDPRSVRVIAAGAMPILTTTIYYTFSRGALWATAVGVVVYVVVGRPRAWLSGAIATIPATLAAAAAANPAGSLTTFPLTPAGYEDGRRVATVVGICVVGAMVLRAAALPLDAWCDRVRLSVPVRRVATVAAIAAAFASAFAAATVLDVPHEIDRGLAEFNTENYVADAGGGGRLLSLGNNGRVYHWDVALKYYRENKLRGAGAGTYELQWAKDRPVGFTVRDGHSLYLETMGELGLVGLGLLCLALLTVLFGLARLARGPDRPLGAALLAAGVAWALHAGVDWDWEMPVVTLWLFAVGGLALSRAADRVKKTQDRSRARSVLGLGFGIVAAIGCCAVAILPGRVALADAQLDQAESALKAGDCVRGVARARDSLGWFEQPAPSQMIAWCTLRTDPPEALASIEDALRVDPDNWELNYGLGVTRAANRLDPRPAMRLAARQDPMEELPKNALRRFGYGRRDPKKWPYRARLFSLTLAQ